jgi:L-threonylcarbamoyladenylate synthase
MKAADCPVLAPDPAAIARAAAEARGGRVVGMPTETLYGLAVDALDPAALERLLAVKERAEEQSLPLLVSDHQMLDRLVTGLPAAASELMRRYWPGPLTLILPGRSGLPRPIVNDRGGIGVRISSDPVAAAVVAAAGRPLTATSANRSGAAPARTAVEAALPGVALVLDGGERANPPSTVVDTTVDPPVVVRSGGLHVDLR